LPSNTCRFSRQGATAVRTHDTVSAKHHGCICQGSSHWRGYVRQCGISSTQINRPQGCHQEGETLALRRSVRRSTVAGALTNLSRWPRPQVRFSSAKEGVHITALREINALKEVRWRAAPRHLSLAVHPSRQLLHPCSRVATPWHNHQTAPLEWYTLRVCLANQSSLSACSPRPRGQPPAAIHCAADEPAHSAPAGCATWPFIRVHGV
jgi:hypothetical protein